MYVIQRCNHDDEVYDIIISDNIPKNHKLLHIINVKLTITYIRLLLDPNCRMTYISNNVLYLQSGLVNIQTILN